MYPYNTERIYIFFYNFLGNEIEERNRLTIESVIGIVNFHFKFTILTCKCFHKYNLKLKNKTFKQYWKFK